MVSHKTRKRWERLRRLLRSADGPTAVEYAILLAMIILVAVGAIETAGGMMAVCYENIAGAVSTVGF